jgi:hypothetical protein
MQNLLPSIIGQALTAPPTVNPRAGLTTQENIDEAALRQAAISLATAGWLPPSIAPNKNPEYLMDPQYVEKFLVMNMLLQQQQQQYQQQPIHSPTLSSTSSVITDAIRRNLIHTNKNNDPAGGGSSMSSTGTSSPHQNSMSGGGLELPPGQVSPASSSLQNPTLNTLDLASSLLLQHFSVAPN